MRTQIWASLAALGLLALSLAGCTAQAGEAMVLYQTPT